VTGPRDPGDELRQHWRALADAPAPAEMVEGAKSRARRTRQDRGRNPALAVLAAAAVLVVAVAGFRAASTAPDASPEPSASGRPSAVASSNAASPTPAAAIAPGDVAVVRTSFTLVSDRRVEVGQKVFVVDGPVDHEGEPSYLIQHWGDLEHGLRPDSDFGWLAASDAVAWLEPVIVDCPTGAATIRDAARLQLFERPLCFGDRDLTFGPVTASDRQYGGRTSTRWLSDDGRPDFFTGLPFYVHDIANQVADGAWVEVTGHFDDPSSAECGDAAAIAWCRQRFFVTAVREVEPPAFVLRGEWRSLAEPPIGGRTGHAMTWTGSEVLIWGGAESNREVTVFDEYLPAHGAAWDPVTNRWRRTTEAPIDGRRDPVAAWTGRELLVWGGSAKRDGAAYDPVGDAWRVLPEAPLDGTPAVGGWVGGRFIVLTDAAAAAYDPATDTWASLDPAPVRTGWRIAAVAADRLVVIAFGDGASGVVEGAILDPSTGNWARTQVPAATLDAGVETFGAGDVAAIPRLGRVVDPLTGTWSTMTRCEGAANGGTWTGRYLIGAYGAWDSETDECLDLPLAPPRGEPFEDTRGREFAVGVWTGEEYVTWSGGTGGDIVWVPNDGAAFRPAP
jgi:hypothetical protein